MNKLLFGYDIEVSEDDDFDITELEEEDNDYDLNFEMGSNNFRHYIYSQRNGNDNYRFNDPAGRGGRR